jgi:hypothetical protein
MAMTKVLETKEHYAASAAEVVLRCDSNRIEITLQPPRRERGRGGIRNVVLNPQEAKILGYALLANAERAQEWEHERLRELEAERGKPAKP